MRPQGHLARLINTNHREMVLGRTKINSIFVVLR